MGFLKKALKHGPVKVIKPVVKPIVKPVGKVIKPVVQVAKPVALIKPVIMQVAKPVIKPVLKPILKPVLKNTEKLANAAADLIKKASPKPLSKCARFVRISLKKYGIIIDPTKFAKDYGAKLLKAGFKEIDPTGGFLVGDIVIFLANQKHKCGHMQMYTKDGWYSDFKQRDIYPGEFYRNAKSPYKVYRLQ